ncbi:hypothetical protein, partial [Bartonella sp. CL43QHWL]
IPSKMQYFDKALVKGSKDVWDFRLEDRNLLYERNSISFVGGNRERAGVNIPSVQPRETVGSEVDNSSVGSTLPSGTSESTPPNRVITSSTNGDPALLRRSDTGDINHEEVGNEPSTISDPLSPSLHISTIGGTVDGSSNRGTDPYMLGGNLGYHEELYTTDGNVGISLLNVDPSQTVSQNEAEYDIVGYSTSDTVGVNSVVHQTETGQTETGNEDHTEGGYDGYVESEASGAVTPLPSPTTSSIISTVSEGGASTDQ